MGEKDAVNEWISRAIRVPGAKIVRWIGSGGIPERFNKNVSTSDRNSRPARPLDERYAKNGGEDGVWRQVPGVVGARGVV